MQNQILKSEKFDNFNPVSEIGSESFLNLNKFKRISKQIFDKRHQDNLLNILHKFDGYLINLMKYCDDSFVFQESVTSSYNKEKTIEHLEQIQSLEEEEFEQGHMTNSKFIEEFFLYRFSIFNDIQNNFRKGKKGGGDNDR